MEPSTNQSARIAKLNEEMDGIHFVNCLYWKRGDLATTKREPNTNAGKIGWTKSAPNSINCN